MTKKIIDKVFRNGYSQGRMNVRLDVRDAPRGGVTGHPLAVTTCHGLHCTSIYVGQESLPGMQVTIPVPKSDSDRCAHAFRF